MTSTGRRGYVGVQRHWLTCTELSDTDLRLMLWLDSHTDEYLSRLHVKSVAEQLGWGRDRVARSLKSLAELGLISTEQVHHTGSGSRTKITLHQSEWTEQHGASPQGTPVHDGEAQPVPHGEAPTTSTSIEKKSNLGPSLVTEAFDAFWAMYPKRRDKQDTRRAFDAALKRVGPAVIGEGLRAWVTYWTEAKTEQQYIRDPKRWLSKSSYLDEPPPIAPSKADTSMAGRLARVNQLVEQGWTLEDARRKVGWQS